MSSDSAPSAPPVIVARGLTKAYRIWRDPAQRLLGPLFAEGAAWLPGEVGAVLRRKAHAAYRDFHALQDVDFEVRRGEAVGIVGRNGSGKSTLLQMIAGTLQPTAGTVEVHGRVAALLELGAGFNPDFTGRENVFLSGAVLGLSQSEMEARFDSVAAFADIGDFIEQPVKTYSSGMMMRLAFAVNTCVDPEVLIVDEALSVGDAPFQAKCFRRLRQLTDEGVSLLFVSHDLGTVRSICSRALWLKNGRAERWGEAKEVAREYEKYCWQEQGVVMEETAPTQAAPASGAAATASAQPIFAAGAAAATEASQPPEELFAGPDLPAHTTGDRYGTQAIVIRKLLCTNLAGEPAMRFEFDEPLVLHYLLEARQAVDSDIVIGVRIKDTKDNFVYSAQDIVTQHRLKTTAGGRVYARTVVRLPLAHGQYLLKTGIFGFAEGVSRPNGRYDYGRAILWDIVEDCHTFEVGVHPAMPLVGPVHAHAALALTPLPAAPSDLKSP